MYFQDVILTLQDYWARQGCVIEEPSGVECGAGTFNPNTFLRVLGPEPWSVAYVEPSRRPTDGRYGENPNRLQRYFQFQVILKPSPGKRAGSLSGKPERAGHQSRAAGHPLCGRRLGIPHARRMGSWLGSLAQRHGSQPVHLLPAGGRHRSLPRQRGAHLRARTPRHVSSGRGIGL